MKPSNGDKASHAVEFSLSGLRRDKTAGFTNCGDRKPKHIREPEQLPWSRAIPWPVTALFLSTAKSTISDSTNFAMTNSKRNRRVSNVARLDAT